jgi:rare lipoprotein A (peptidoglycan hydrolase)
VIDLSHAAAKKLGMVKKGAVKVKVVAKTQKKKIPKKEKTTRQPSG